MSTQKNWEALRALTGKRDGYRCAYCRVPTAATLEHVEPRSKGGSSWADNLVLACPYCNQRKSVRPAEEFRASGDWKLSLPDDVPSGTRAMLKQYFGWDHSSGLVATGSTNAKLELQHGQVSLLVRPGKSHEWERVLLGAADHPAVTGASWDFLSRHFTPKKPKRKRPPKSAFVKKGRR